MAKRHAIKILRSPGGFRYRVIAPDGRIALDSKMDYTNEADALLWASAARDRMERQINPLFSPEKQTMRARVGRKGGTRKEIIG